MAHVLDYGEREREMLLREWFGEGRKWWIEHGGRFISRDSMFDPVDERKTRRDTNARR